MQFYTVVEVQPYMVMLDVIIDGTDLVCSNSYGSIHGR